MGKLKPINPTKAQIVANPQAAAHDYDNLTHKPQINGHELVGDKSSDDLGLQGKLTAGENITINANGEISATGGTDDYEELTNKPQINGHELSGDQSGSDLGLQNQLTAGDNVTIENGVISASGGVSVTVSSAAVNQNGTITFTMSDGSTVTTTGESVIGPQGDDYVLTPQDKTDIANIVLQELPTTEGVLYGN